MLFEPEEIEFLNPENILRVTFGDRHAEPKETVRDYLVLGATMNGEEISGYRHQRPEDDEWITVAQSRKAIGIYEHISHGISMSRLHESGLFESKQIITKDDKFLRLIGDDFVIVDPRTEASLLRFARHLNIG